jgi:hypothetical protein
MTDVNSFDIILFGLILPSMEGRQRLAPLDSIRTLVDLRALNVLDLKYV